MPKRLPNSGGVPTYVATSVKPISLPQVASADGGRKLGKASDRELGNALKPAIEQVVLDTLRENPKIVIDIVYPVLGRVIRKSITSALQSLVASVESQAADVFSLKRLKWRWQAFTSQRSYAEIVLANSVVCSVDEVLLIHRETGLLLVHASRDSEHARDADLVSSMLTAIEDFARDSFDLDADDSLSSFSMGGQTVLIRTSPMMLIAAAVAGNPTSKVNDMLDEVMETLHSNYHDALANFCG
ncbi:MAG: hypothetical protein O3C21_10420 [Verrucomicrobia bacterium]|nr:hypothetical protein [Verrucomicrobiota bacterium]